MYRSGYRYPVKFRYPVVSGIRKNFTGYLPDNISVFEIDETGVKTLEREFKSCLTGLTAPSFVDCQTCSSFI